MDYSKKLKLIEFLEQFITDSRRQKIIQVLSERTRYLTVVLEDIFQPQNASAVLRTCECLGIQDVHIIENENQFEVNPDVVLGASKWLTLHNYNLHEFNTMECLQGLLQKGYKIVGTTPLPGALSLEQLDLGEKSAIIFGNEQKGISQAALQMAHEFIHIPMVGFTESFNISVSAAIIINHLSHELKKNNIPWQLPQNESIDLKIEWLKNSVRQPEKLVNYFLEQYSDIS
jgi:tRNA (guanosine-2'-O-)-methyltransferase